MSLGVVILSRFKRHQATIGVGGIMGRVGLQPCRPVARWCLAFPPEGCRSTPAAPTYSASSIAFWPPQPGSTSGTVLSTGCGKPGILFGS